MASGQRMKKFSAQKEERVKFVPNKIWLPFRTQVSVKQVNLVIIIFILVFIMIINNLMCHVKPMSSFKNQKTKKKQKKNNFN